MTESVITNIQKRDEKCTYVPQESWAIAKMTVRCTLHMGALKNFESLNTPTATFPEIFNGLLSDRSYERACLQNLKFVAWHVPEIESTQKMDSHWIHSGPLFSEIFNVLLLGWTLWMHRSNLKSVALPVPEIIAIEVLGGGCEPPILGKRSQ